MYRKSSVLFCIIIFMAFAKVSSQNTFADSLKLNTEKANEVFGKTLEFKEEPVKVKVISTCSTDPKMCGFFVFGSVSLVEIEEGKYKGDSICVIEACAKTNYKEGEIYELRTRGGITTGIHLCTGELIGTDWYLDPENKYFIVEGWMTMESVLK